MVLTAQNFNGADALGGRARQPKQPVVTGRRLAEISLFDDRRLHTIVYH
jgi:hypothetical protein